MQCVEELFGIWVIFWTPSRADESDNCECVKNIKRNLNQNLVNIVSSEDVSELSYLYHIMPSHFHLYDADFAFQTLTSSQTFFLSACTANT